jgi:multiple sugar transport system ATP-binding protein
MLDEPLANLDALIRLQMRTELKRIHQELEKTMIYITHDQVEAMTMSDRVAVLNKGSIQQIGSPDDIYMRPVNKFVGGFFGSPPMNFVEARLESHDGRRLLVWGEQAVEASKLVARAKDLKDQTSIILGIRPEDFLIKPDDGGGSGLNGRVTSLEQLGAKTVIDVELDNQKVRISVPTTFAYKVNDSCVTEMNIARGHLFDPETELNLTRG